MSPRAVDGSMTRPAVAALLLAALLLPLAPPAEAQGSRALLVNFHTATPQGCGEWGGGAHYAYRVLVDGAQVHLSPVWDPIGGVVQYYELVRADIGTRSSVVVSFEVIDHSFGFFGTSKHACNLTAGGGTRISVTYQVGSPQMVRGGTTQEGAAIQAYVSDTTLPAPTVPTLRLSGAPAADRAALAYDAVSIPGFSGADLLAPDRAMAKLATLGGASSGTHTMTGLSENTPYQAQLRAYGGSWAISSEAVRFTTANLAPPAPTLRLLRANETAASLAYDNPPGDYATLQVHVSTSRSFTPGNATLRATVNSPWTTVDLAGLAPGTEHHVVARVTDHGGLATQGAVLSFRTAGAAAAPANATGNGTAAQGNATADAGGGQDAGGASAQAPATTGAGASTQAKAEAPSLDAVFEARVEADVDPGTRMLNVTPGSRHVLRVVLVNRGTAALRVEAAAAQALHRDADLRVYVPVDGYGAALSTTNVSLAAVSKHEATFTLQVPADAAVGDVVSIRQPLRVTGANASSDAYGLEVVARVVPAPVEAVAAATADGGDGGGSVLAYLAAGGAAVAVSAGAAWLVLRRDAARYALAATLYTRLARSAVLDHPTRDALRKRIAEQPGVCYSELRAASGLNTGALVHHLRALERAGVVASRKDGAFRRFYVVGAAPPPAAFHVSPLTPMQQRVLEELRAAPLTQGELAARLGLTQQGVSHHVKALERAGHLAAEYDGRAWRYRPTAASDALRP